MKTKHLPLTAALALSVTFATAFNARADAIYISNYDDDEVVSFTQEGVASSFAIGLSNPEGLVFDNAGNLYVANSGDNTVRKISPDGIASVFASTGLNSPHGLAFDTFGNLYVANVGDNTIHKFTPGGTDSIFADAADNLDLPWALAFDGAGNLFVGNAADNGAILKFAPDGVGSVFAHQLAVGLTFDGAGNLYAADDSGISKFTPGGVATGFALQGLDKPGGPAFDSAGYLYVPNRDNGNILKFTPEGDSYILFGRTGSGPQFIAIQPGLPVPEPATLGLLAVSSLLLAARRRRRSA